MDKYKELDIIAFSFASGIFFTYGLYILIKSLVKKNRDYNSIYDPIRTELLI
jgi:hypothetical protein